MYYTGIDLHKKTSFITTIDADGKIVTRANLQNVEEDILAYFATLAKRAKSSLNLCPRGTGFMIF